MMLKTIALFLLLICLLRPTPAYADFFGGDLPLLAEIVANTLQQISQLSKVIGTGEDTFNYIRDINRGIQDALNLAKTMNEKLNPGILSDLQGAEQALAVIEKLYGSTPKTSEARVQQTMDRTAAEAINLHNEAFRYADQIDPEAERIKDYAHVVSPAGAGKLTAQSLGVLIHVMNQVLRTNAAMLKLQGEQLALQNRREKLSSEQFKIQYESLSKAFGSLKPEYKLPRLSSN
ncbi:MAG: hypothetical protein HY537_17625 [Deltaproteobacteria bacterium]|nr:hypothetical protein [Deltaproteobacteria bacterium]